MQPEPPPQPPEPAGDQAAHGHAGRTDSISVGDITNSAAVAVGPGATAVSNVTVARPAAPTALHQLRPPVPDFFGREQEIAELLEALRGDAQGVAISGLAGMGGIGKTELAFKVADALRDLYPEAQIVLALEGSRDPSLPPAEALRRVIRAFAPDAQLPDEEPLLLATFRSLLDGKRVLLLADDARDATQIRPLLPPRGSALLITSRRRFALPGMRLLNLERLDEGAAVALLRELAPRLSEDEAGEIARACGLLPLALRVAGSLLAITPALSVQRYLARLADEKKLAALRNPDDPDQDVEASIALSYDLLPAAARADLCALGVFAASFDQLAATTVLDEPDSDALEERLGLLYRRSLLEYDAEAGRYDLHELVRAFALARLDPAAERATRLRHARHYIAVAEGADRLYLAGGDGIATGLTRFDRERGQIDAARHWLQECEEDDEIDRLLISEAAATGLIGHLRYAIQTERLPQLKHALKATQRCKNYAAQSVFLGNLGVAYADLGDAQQAIELYQQALFLARELGDQRNEGNVLGNLGNAYTAFGNTQQAIDLHQQYLSLAREIGDRRGEGVALGGLGLAYAAIGDTHQAIDFYRQRLSIAYEIGDRRGLGNALTGLGNAYIALGDASQAIDIYHQTLKLARELDDLQGEGSALGNLGNAYANLGDTQQAIEYYQKHLALAREIGDRGGEGNSLGNLGNIYVNLGNTQQGVNYYQKHLTLAREIGDRRGEGNALGNLGNAYTKLGDEYQAINFYEKHLYLAHQIGDQRSEASASWNYGLALARQGKTKQAIQLLEASYAFFQQIGHINSASLQVTVTFFRTYNNLTQGNNEV